MALDDVQPIANRKRLGDFVFEKLLRAIKSGAYEADERLPTEHELASEFQVSRPVVRDALQRLRDQGLIYSRRGSGSFVRNLGVREPLGFGQLENLGDLRQCYEFRLTLEPEAAAGAALRHDADALAAIKSALDLLRDATSQHRHREDADFGFHLAIAQASRNQYFATAMEALKDHIAVGMQFHGISLKMTSGGLQHAFAEHDAIYNAIKAGDADAARQRMREHLIGSRDRLFEGTEDKRP
ncbi:FadR/GntR family transcriptional regulator [Pelagibacterium xiamenense]|uniref:FadR/GntR family transcriptional regulator n=1 Tax=Pelagibacterium xiamenense TaxID=2901140 RepID=UPI001E4C3FC1|nr:FadR/GntR family transcriptional regulator [Pelagibacterium xiamenense]MCD7059711.1 FadR family transcriptional regulator [Pelagibacterium xiamenense]